MFIFCAASCVINDDDDDDDNGWDKQERKAQKKMGRRPTGLVQQGYLHPVWSGVGQEEVESFREVDLCRGHQRALSPWSKKKNRRR